MPVTKSEFSAIHPCEFYRPEELLEEGLMYTVPEIARLLQGSEPDVALDPETEGVLIDWAIPWIMLNADALVVGEPERDTDPGYYGLREA